MAMRFEVNGSRVIRSHQVPDLWQFMTEFPKRSHNMSIDFLQGLYFSIHTSLMGRFVGGFNMNTNKIDVLLLDRLDRSPPFCSVIGIQIACRTGDFDAAPIDQLCQSAKQIDCGNHSSAGAVC